MANDTWTDIEEVPNFLAAADWEDRLGNLSKSQLLLIAEFLELHIVEGSKKGVILMKVANAVKVSKERKGSEGDLMNESLLLDKQYQVQEKEVEKLKIQAQMQEQLMKENEMERKERVGKRKREGKRTRIRKSTLNTSITI